jgi:putative transcriptional regulator
MRHRASPVTPQQSSAARRDLLAKASRGELPWSEAIVLMRLSLGMSQEEFARMFRLPRRRLIDLEKGKANPTVETLVRIGRAFGLVVGFVPKAAERSERPASSASAD